MRSSNPKSLGVFAAVLACAVALLGIGASAAAAAPSASLGWSFQASFENGTQQFNNGEEARNTVAVDSNGNVFVANEQNPYIRVFAPGQTSGEYLTEITVAAANVTGLAVDVTDDTLYTREGANLGGTSIRRFTSDGNPTPSYTVDPGFEVPVADGFAVDPTTQDLLVANSGAEAVLRYEADGTLTETISTPGFDPKHIAIAADGSFYVSSASGTDVQHFSGTGTALGTISSVGSVGALAWDSTDDAMVALVGDTLKTYSGAGVLLSETLTQTEKGAGNGLAYDSARELLYQNTWGTTYVFARAVFPGVDPPVISEILGHSAHLSAEVDPGEGPPAESKVHFEYSDDGGVSWVSTPDQELVSEDVTEVTAEITGLLANQEYLVRVKASNEKASKTSSTASFTTAQIAPEVDATGASAVQVTSAVLNGSINPNGLQTTYYFEYGTTTGYGSRVPVAADGVAGGQRVSRTFSQFVSGLQPGASYHYRLVAENAAGKATSGDATFTTAAGGDFPKRAYEQVTPVDKEGAQVSSTFHVQVSDQGSAIAVAAASGAKEKSETSMLKQNFVVRRTPSGWEDWEPTDPPQAAAAGVFESPTHAVSEDFKHAMVASNRVLAPGAVAGDGNLYIKDLQAGTYTFVGHAPGVTGYRQLTGGNVQETVFAAGAPDFSWVLFWTETPMIEGVTGRALYRWTEDEGLTLESLLPSGGIPPTPLANIPNGNAHLPPASADGSLTAFDPAPYFVFFPSFEIGGGVYIRHNGQTTPIAESRIAGPEPGNDTSSLLNWVTPDGRYVFFQSPNRLTEGAPEPHSHLVYRYDTETEELIYIGEKVSPFTFGFQGASEDGQTVYLTDGGFTNQTSVWHNGETRLLANENTAGAQHYMTPDGRYFAWTDANGRAYLYDVEADEKACVSCAPDGSAGSSAHFGLGSRSMGNQEVRAVTDDGTIYFDTKTALLPTDHNSSKDVYAYRGGHLTLISPGNADFDALFVGASADGTDVYFQTGQGLVPKDIDGNADVYDARVGGGFAEATVPPRCSGEGCRGQAGGSPQGPSLGSASTRGDDTGAVISGVKTLTAAQRSTLARGGKVQLKLKVSSAGTVSATGKAQGKRVISASVKAKQAGSETVPLKLSKAGLSELAEGNSLSVRLAIAFDGKTEKTMTLALKPVGKKKGGHS